MKAQNESGARINGEGNGGLKKTRQAFGLPGLKKQNEWKRGLEESPPREPRALLELAAVTGDSAKHDVGSVGGATDG